MQISRCWVNNTITLHNSQDFNDVTNNIFITMRRRRTESGLTKKLNSWFNFSICYWKLNSLTARDFEKVILLEAYKAVNKFDIICLSESFVDSSILTENNNLKNNGYKMVRADDPNNVKKGGMCAYVRDSLPVRNLSNSYCLTLEVNISSKKGYVITLHRSPS